MTTKKTASISSMSKAVVYCRVSTMEQVENNSLPNQEKACNEYCERQGFEVAKIFVDEGESAKTKDRPALLSMIEYCKKSKGKVQAVVFYKIDRFARKQEDFHALRAILSKSGVRLHSATESIQDDPTGKLMEGMLAAFAQFDNDVRAERTVVGMKASLQAGKWTYAAPLGYVNSRTATGEITMEICPETGPLVREMFEMFATGRHTQKEILEHFTRRGLRGKNGKKLRGQTLNKILRNPLYPGWITSSLLGEERVKGNFVPLVSQEIFDGVQGVRLGKRPTITPHLRNHPDFPLRMFVRCGACGKPLTASWSSGNGGKYGYYRCPRKACRQVNTRKERLEGLFVKYLERLKPKPKYVGLLRGIIEDNWKEKQAGSIAERTAMEAQLEKLMGRKQRLVEFLVAGTLDESTYKEQVDSIEAEIIVKQIELNEAKMEGFDIEAVLNFAEHLILNASRLWSEANIDQKQRLQKVFFPEGMTYLHKEFGTAATCLFFNHLQVLRSQKSTLVAPRGIEPLFHG